MIPRHVRVILAALLAATLVSCDNGGGGDAARDVAAGGDTMAADAAPTGDARPGADPGADASAGADAEDAAQDAQPADVSGARDLVSPDAAGPDAAAPGVGGDAGGDAVADVAAIECPPPPDELPAVAVRTDGRFHFVDAFPGEGLAPRTVRIFLPADYEAAPERRHPVVYMHDGQNLFDPAAAAFGEEWEVDEVVDALVAAGAIPPVIVVGVDNTADRLEEYRSGPDPTADRDTLASAYRAFLAERLKPWVDANYRTRCERSATTLIGSSMGGVASLAHALRYPEIWGRVGALSTAFWFGSHELPRWLADHAPPAPPERVWLDVGSAESTTGGANTEFVLDTRAVRDRLRELGYTVGLDLGYREDIGAIHNEREWARRLPDVLGFLLGPAPAAAPAPTGIRLEPFATALLEGGAGTELAVQAELAGRGQTLPNDGVAFESDDEAVLTVRGDGHVTPTGPGSATVTASRDGLSAGATIAVGGEALVTFRVTVPADTPADDTIHVAGNLAQLGAWDGQGVAMTRIGADRWEAVVPLPADTAIAWKYTRGSWATVEKGPGGEEIDDRRATTAPGLVLDDVVARWADR